MADRVHGDFATLAQAKSLAKKNKGKTHTLRGESTMTAHLRKSRPKPKPYDRPITVTFVTKEDTK